MIYDAGERTVAEPKPDSVTLWPRRALRLVGIAGLIFAGMGLWYNGTSIFKGFPYDPTQPYFRHAFYAMSAICVACHLILAYLGVQFLRVRTSLLRLFVGLMVFEVAYIFGHGALFYTIPKLGLSIAAASGVANGGLMFQLLTLFPLWGWLLARWAKTRIELPPVDSTVIHWPEEQVVRSADWVWTAVNFAVLYFLISVLISMLWMRVSPGTMTPGYVMVFVPALLSTAHCIALVRRRRERRCKEIDRRRAARLRAGRCPRCEYNLTGNVSGRCPECGESIGSEAAGSGAGGS